jgi:hypothetical protein
MPKHRDEVGFSPRSGRQHKAWGVSPRFKNESVNRAREAGDSRCANTSLNDAAAARSAGLGTFHDLILGLTPQALR